MQLTNSEQERLAYINNDFIKADLFARLDEYEGSEQEYSIDDCLKLIGAEGLGGDNLYDKLCEVSDKLNRLKNLEAVISKVKTFAFEVVDVLEQIED